MSRHRDRCASLEKRRLGTPHSASHIYRKKITLPISLHVLLNSGLCTQKSCVCLLVKEFCPSLLLSGKPLNDSGVEVRNAPNEFFLNWQHSQSIQAILCHAVPQESLYPFQSGKAPLCLSRSHGCGYKNLQKTDSLCECLLQIIVKEELEQSNSTTASPELVIVIDEGQFRLELCLVQ